MAMKRLAQILVLAGAAALFAQTGDAAAQTANCASNWTAHQYKSFSALQNEIKKQFGDVRILRVSLCGEGGNAYFQIVIISGQGKVQRVQIAASNAAPG
ncbi:MAG: hypothetical protein HC850_00210 [Rhodomicrobium sp.]|nr:hypothetical protein [Rhodomicrobium sp.]